jgi:hypothetical protein
MQRMHTMPCEYRGVGGTYPNQHREEHTHNHIRGTCEHTTCQQLPVHPWSTFSHKLPSHRAKHQYPPRRCTTVVRSMLCRRRYHTMPTSVQPVEISFSGFLTAAIHTTMTTTTRYNVKPRPPETEIYEHDSTHDYRRANLLSAKGLRAIPRKPLPPTMCGGRAWGEVGEAARTQLLTPEPYTQQNWQISVFL